MPIRLLVDSNCRCQSATAKACRPHDCKAIVAVGILARFQMESLFQRFLNQPRSVDMASGPVTDAEEMAALRPMPKSFIKGLYASYLGGRDFSQLANPLQRLFGQIAVTLLNRLQDRYDRVDFAADLVDDALNRLEIKLDL